MDYNKYNNINVSKYIYNTNIKHNENKIKFNKFINCVYNNNWSNDIQYNKNKRKTAILCEKTRYYRNTNNTNYYICCNILPIQNTI